MKLIILIWLGIIIICILEAYFYTEFDQETKEEFKRRKNNNKNL